MTIYKSLITIALVITIASCDRKPDEKFFTFDETNLKAQYKPSDSVSVSILNPQQKTLDSVVYYVNSTNLGTKKDLSKVTFGLNDKKLGYQQLRALVYFDGSAKAEEVESRVELVSDVTPKLLKYTLLHSYPHDISTFTEGLEFYRDTLYESGGQYAESKLLKVDFKTGNIYRKLDLEKKYFGEGITIIGKKIYQLTWKENTGFIYDAATWKVEKTFSYDKPIEGWGMTNDGRNIYQSDGSEKIWTMDPETQKMTDYINVYAGGDKIKSVNELEWIDGKIYGNVWQKDAIAVINPGTGAVEGILNLAALRKEIHAPNAEVLNGIAYNPKTKTIFVTGKYWDKLFEIKIDN